MRKREQLTVTTTNYKLKVDNPERHAEFFWRLRSCSVGRFFLRRRLNRFFFKPVLPTPDFHAALKVAGDF